MRNYSGYIVKSNHSNFKVFFGIAITLSFGNKLQLIGNILSIGNNYLYN